MSPIRSRSLVLFVALLAGCATTPRVEVPQPLQVVNPAPEPVPADAAAATADAGQRGLRQVATPVPPGARVGQAGGNVADAEPPLEGEDIGASLEGLPLPSFINEAFGNLLKLNYQVDPSLANRNDLVTLRLPSPQTPQAFYRLAVQVLRAYGVGVSWDGNLLTVAPAAQLDASVPPLFISGRALPDVPVSHRPVFQLVELQAVRPADVSNWLRVAFPRQEDLSIQEDLNRTAIMLYGKPDIVRQAGAAIRVLDQPFMRGRFSTRLEPAFVSAEELARRLVEALNAQGYAAATQMGPTVGTLVMPVASANVVLVFAPSNETLGHVVAWARTIDTPNTSVGGDSLHYYQVRNTRAADIVRTLRSFSGTSGGSRNANRAARTNAGATGAAAEAADEGAGSDSSTSVANGRLAVDEPRNAIIFQGGAADWQRLLSLVEKMDRAARQVMVEVTIAEVSLDDGENFGVSWFAKGGIGRFGGQLNFGTLPGSGTGDDEGSTGGGGLTYLLDVAGENRMALNAFADDQRVSILSTPRLLVKSGEQASIDVGTEVPTLTTQTTSTQQTGGDTALLQGIQYRKTGILLNIKPTVYSDDRIDLEVSQEVSEALPISDGSAVSSPSIFNRKVETSLSLRDGGSVLLGGLMSQRQTDGRSGVPMLKDVPLLGGLFRSQSKSSNKTELVLIIRPYIIETDDDAQAVSNAITGQLEFIDVPARDEQP